MRINFGLLRTNYKFPTLVVVFLSLIAGWFYWYQWRPSQIVTQCDQIAYNDNYVGWVGVYRGYQGGPVNETFYQLKFNQCLNSKGLK